MFPFVTAAFAKWLQGELDRRGISARELALAMESSPATVYRIINGERGVGREVAGKIARALKVADSVVLYQAGFLERDPQDPTQELDPLALEILQLTANRPDSEQAAILATVKALVENFDLGSGKREPTSGAGGTATRTNKG